MRLEIRDVEDTTVYRIGPDGAVLGRERAKTDISLRDESVSKRHARIFSDDGTWLLEDLNSSNGTYIDEQRITGPVPISEGSVFALAQRKFEVVYVESANEPSQSRKANGGGVNGLANGANGGMRPPHKTVPPLMGPSTPSPVSPSVSRAVGKDEKSAAAILAAVPRAVAHYLVNVPLMLLNPVGSIRKATEKQPVEPMGRMELAVFVIPAGAVAFSIFALVANAFSNTPLGGGLVGAAIGMAFAAIAGFLLHPVLEFLVELLGGTSDERSRTNHVVQAFELLVIVAVTQGGAALLAMLSVSFAGLAAPVLAILVALIFLYFAYRWVVRFRLFSWVRYVVVALGCALVLVSVAGLVQRARMPFAGSDRTVTVDVGGSPAGPAGPEPGATGATPAARTPAGLAQDTAGATPARPTAAVANVKQSTPPERAGPVAAAMPPALRSGGPAPATAAAPPAPRSEAPASSGAGSGGEPQPIVTAEHPFGETPFVRFLAKRRAIERAVNDRPELLERRPVRRDYERLWRKTYAIREKYRKKRGERWKRDKILARRKDQEIFDATRKEVDRLYAKIFR